MFPPESRYGVTCNFHARLDLAKALKLFLLDTMRRITIVFVNARRFRHRCLVIVKHPAFDKIILLFIALNCITLAMERPSIPDDSLERAILSISNDLFTVLFLAEMSLKVIALGGFAQYFKSGWNIMDGVLVSVSVVDQIMSLFMSR